MTLPHRPRGRPKGSGINDRQRLRDIAALISSQPQIKPTTAIKMLGEHDPSVIRRLRDKFYSLQNELMEEVRAGRFGPAGASSRATPSMSSPLANTQGSARADGSIRANVAAVGAAPLSRMGEPMAVPATPCAAEFAPGLQHEPTTQADDRTGRAEAEPRTTQPDMDAPTALDLQKAKLMDLAAYNVMLGFAIQATVKAMGHQAKAYDQTLRLPPVAALLKQQIAIGEMVMAMTWPGGQSRLETQFAAATGV